MNKVLSIIELHARRSLWKVLAALAAGAAVQIALFALKLKSDPTWDLYKGKTALVMGFALMLLIVTVILGGLKPDKSGSQQRIRLLSATGRVFYLSEVVYDLFCMLMAWAVQVLVVLACARIYMGAEGYNMGDQGPVLQIYSHYALLSIVPMKDVGCWARTIMTVLSMALAAAYMKDCNRRSIFPAMSCIVIVIAAIWFLNTATIVDKYRTGIFTAPAAALFFAACSAGFAVSRAGKDREEADDGE